jgi:hypothetical protein
LRAASRATEPRPQHTTRVKAPLTLRSQLRPTRSRRTRVSRRGFGLRTFLVGSSDRWTLVRRPVATAFSAADEECESTSDVPCRRSRKKAETPFDIDQDRFHRRLVKDDGFSGPERLPSTSARSAPLSRHLEREPATRNSDLAVRSGLPTLFRLPQTGN